MGGPTLGKAASRRSKVQQQLLPLVSLVVEVEVVELTPTARSLAQLLKVPLVPLFLLLLRVPVLLAVMVVLPSPWLVPVRLVEAGPAGVGLPKVQLPPAR